MAGTRLEINSETPIELTDVLFQIKSRDGLPGHAQDQRRRQQGPGCSIT